MCLSLCQGTGKRDVRAPALPGIRSYGRSVCFLSAIRPPCPRLILHKAQDFHKGRFIFASFPVWDTLGFLQWAVFAGFPPVLNAARKHGSIEFYRGLRINDSARFLNASPIPSTRNEPSSFSTAGRPASPVSLNSGSNGICASRGTS